MASYAQTIAEDLIAQMATRGEATPWPVPYTATYQPGYLADREDLPPAGDPDSRLQVILAPVQLKPERTAWGGARITVSLGILFRVGLDVADGVVIDTLLPSYEDFIDDFCTWLAGPRQIASVWTPGPATAIYGDAYQEHLQDMQFHVPVLAEFFCDVSVG